jgi:hypothetical protein
LSTCPGLNATSGVRQVAGSYASSLMAIDVSNFLRLVVLIFLALAMIVHTKGVDQPGITDARSAGADLLGLGGVLGDSLGSRRQGLRRQSEVARHRFEGLSRATATRAVQ